MKNSVISWRTAPGWILGLIGATVLLGWMAGNHSLVRGFSASPAMTINTAVLFLFSGLSLILSARTPDSRLVQRVLVPVLIGLPVLILLVVAVVEVLILTIPSPTTQVWAHVLFYGLLGPAVTFFSLEWIAEGTRAREWAELELRELYGQLRTSHGRLQGVFVVVVAGGPGIGDMLAGGATKLLTEGWVLLIGGVLCMAVTWTVAHLQCGFLRYDARNPVP